MTSYGYYCKENLAGDVLLLNYQFSQHVSIVSFMTGWEDW